MHYALSTSADATWSEGPHRGLRHYDLKLGTASSGQLGARHIAATAAGEAAAWDGGAVPTFGMLYVTAGSITLGEGESAISMKHDDCAYQDIVFGLGPVSWSEDFQGFEIVTPAHGARVAPFETLAFEAGEVPTGLRRMTSDAFQPDGGPRTFFVYRDLGTAQATGGRVHVHVVRAIGVMEGGTGWHVHSMSQMFYVVSGWVLIAVDGEPPVRMAAGDAMCLARGMRHDVADFSPDYVVFEICLPADYSTIPTPAPEASEA